MPIFPPPSPPRPLSSSAAREKKIKAAGQINQEMRPWPGPSFSIPQNQLTGPIFS
jgi:hypothetical protein